MVNYRMQARCLLERSRDMGQMTRVGEKLERKSQISQVPQVSEHDRPQDPIIIPHLLKHGANRQKLRMPAKAREAFGEVWICHVEPTRYTGDDVRSRSQIKEKIGFRLGLRGLHEYRPRHR